MESEDEPKIYTTGEVYQPAEDSIMVARTLAKQIAESKKQKLDILDIGTGTGIIGIIASRSKKVSSVNFVDIDKKALLLAKQNWKDNKKGINTKAVFVKSDLFSKIKGKFDFVVFNAPYLPDDESGKTRKLSNAWDGGKEGIDVSIRFIRGVRGHLKKNGKALLVASSFSSLKKLRRFVRLSGFQCKAVAKEHIFFEDIVVLEIKAK